MCRLHKWCNLHMAVQIKAVQVSFNRERNSIIMKDLEHSPWKAGVGIFYSYAVLFVYFRVLPQEWGYIWLIIILCPAIVKGVHRMLVPFNDAKDIRSEDLNAYSKWYGAFTILFAIAFILFGISTQFCMLADNLKFFLFLCLFLIMGVMYIFMDRFYRKRKKNEGEDN